MNPSGVVRNRVDVRLTVDYNYEYGTSRGRKVDIRIARPVEKNRSLQIGRIRYESKLSHRKRRVSLRRAINGFRDR